MAEHYGALEFGAGARPGLRHHYENPAFSYGDGIALACTILIHRPANIIEVGSGYSSAATLDGSRDSAPGERGSSHPATHE
jgi:hypothetical protein